MWWVILVTSGFIVFCTYALYFKRGETIGRAMALQWWWLSVPMLLILANLGTVEAYKAIDLTAYVGNGILLGQVFCLLLGLIGMGIKKFGQAF